MVCDGLVPLDSVHGRHEDPGRCLAFLSQNLWIAQGMNHINLLTRPEVGTQLVRRLQSASRTAAYKPEAAGINSQHKDETL